ncbi:hypothetical protein D3C78_1879090 [compost metagenome]
MAPRITLIAPCSTKRSCESFSPTESVLDLSSWDINVPSRPPDIDIIAIFIKPGFVFL